MIFDDNKVTEPSLKNLLEAVLECVKFGRKEVYELASKLCGQIISKIKQIEKNEINKNISSIPFFCKTFPRLLLSKIESKFLQKDGIDGIATSLCAISKSCPEFFERSSFLRLMTTFRRLKPRGRFEFLLAIYNSTDILSSSSSSSSSSTLLKSNNNSNRNDRITESWENNGEIDDSEDGGNGSERGRDEKSGGMSVIDHLRPFLSSLLADLSTVVIRYEDSFVDSRVEDPGSQSPRIRLPMVQLLTVKLLLRYADTLDITLIDQLVRTGIQEDGSSSLHQSTDHGSNSFGLSLVLHEKAVLKVEFDIYNIRQICIISILIVTIILTFYNSCSTTIIT